MALDEASLRKQVRFCIESGAHGLVGPANASEFPTLSDDERKRWLEIVIGETGSQIPVIAATTSGHARPVAVLSKWSQDVGADGVMAMPPSILSPGPQGCYDYFAATSNAIEIPIFIQNYSGPAGTPMPTEWLARMCKELEWVQYLKEETLPEPRAISATLAATGDACKGVFGGQGAIYILDEYRRGSQGNMPACQITDLHVAVWNKLEAGDAAGARTLFNRILPLINFERMHGVATYKEVLYRRGIFTSRTSRAPGKFLDDNDRAELDASWPTSNRYISFRRGGRGMPATSMALSPASTVCRSNTRST